MRYLNLHLRLEETISLQLYGYDQKISIDPMISTVYQANTFMDYSNC